MHFLEPIHPNDLLNVRAQIHDIQEKESGTVVTGRIYAYKDGRKAIDAYSTLFIRARGAKKTEAKPAEKAPEAAPARDLVLNESFTVDKDQATRYAEASLDRNPIHLDEGAARGAGLPGVILHGLCTMAMSTRPFVQQLAGGDPTRLKRFSVRFSKPVLPGDTLTVTAWNDGEKDGRRVLGFEVKNQKGENVVTNGVAEIA
jgi:acyl dehydratase